MYPALPQPYHPLLFLFNFFSTCLVLLVLSSKHGQAHMHTPHSPKVIAESQRFPGTRKNNKDWGLIHFLPGAAVLLERRPPVNSLHVEQGKPMQSERQKIVIFTDLGSLLSAASCFLFFIFFLTCWRSEGRNDRQTWPLLSLLRSSLPQRLTASHAGFQRELKPG